MTTNREQIRVIAYREGEAWVAQCIEYDISAQGIDFDTAMRRLTATVNAECEYTRKKHGEGLAGIDAAPAIFGEWFEAGNNSLRTDNIELRIAA